MKKHSMLPILKRYTGVFLIVMLLTTGLPTRPVSADGTTRYVAPRGANSGNCISSAAPCATIAYAIFEADAGDTINIWSGTYPEHITVDKNLTFTGQGPDVTILDGSASGQVVIVNAGNTENFSDLTIQNGLTGSNPGAGMYVGTGSTVHLQDVSVTQNIASFYDGGGIYNLGDLTISDSEISHNNSTVTGRGGGIFNTGTLHLSDVQIFYNSALHGGGIYSTGMMSVQDTAITSNYANTNSASDGGGLYLDLSYGVVELDRVTISNNAALHYGGGLYINGNSSQIIINTTISGNSAPNGGAVATSDGSTEFINSTIANNNSAVNGGILNTTNARMHFKNTILAYNEVSNCVNTSFFDLDSYGNNLDSGYTCGFSHAGDWYSTNPSLGPLASNGGLTQTMALLAGSVAIDAGSNTDCPETDQRGIPRPIGTACDIGAYEFESTISGNAGVAGASLNYDDGGSKTANADASGNYSFMVPYDWSGTVTPVLAGYSFSPVYRSYTNVEEDQNGQDYSATLTPTDTPTSTPTDTATFTPSDTETFTPTSTETSTPTDTATSTQIYTPTRTPSPTRTATFTRTPTSTSTRTPTFTLTNTPTHTNTATFTPTNTPTRTNMPTLTSTYTPTNTVTPAMSKIYLPVIIKDQANIQAVNLADSLQSLFQRLLDRLINQSQLRRLDSETHTDR